MQRDQAEMIRGMLMMDRQQYHRKTLVSRGRRRYLRDQSRKDRGLFLVDVLVLQRLRRGLQQPLESWLR